MSEIAWDNSYARLPDIFSARVEPARVPAPRLVALNEALAQELGLDVAWLRSEAGLAMLSGNRMPDGADPIAMVYAGHQFGGFSPQLGDGRAALLGEVRGRDGIRRDVQLKGSGRTPFSRQGDGKSPLGPVLREYLVSEAMAAYGIPTTRALAAVSTGEEVFRETALPGGILTRVAQSHVRVGTFEYFAATGETEALRQLADYVIDRHYPEARASEEPYAALLEAVALRQAQLIARWMQIGFVHGVMNTDNMQIAGETIDFGPCAFMEAFDPATVFSSIDTRGRYAWSNQPGIGQWNLSRLAEALLPLLDEEDAAALEKAKKSLGVYAPAFNQAFQQGFRIKLGLPSSEAAAGESLPGSDAEPGPDDLVEETFRVLAASSIDFTLFFRQLTRVGAGEAPDALLALFAERAAGEAWLQRWRDAVGGSGSTCPGADQVAAMRRCNPIFIPRNHRVEEAIQAAYAGDFSLFERLHRVLEKPFEEQAENADYERPASPGERVLRTFCGT